jgi:hypothetical protein
VFRKVYTNIFKDQQSAPKSLMNEKIQSKVALKRYLNNTYSTLLMNSYCLKVIHPPKGLYKNIKGKCRCICADLFETCEHLTWTLCVLYFYFYVKAPLVLYVHILCLYDLLHILRSLLTGTRSMECNIHVYVCVCMYDNHVQYGDRVESNENFKLAVTVIWFSHAMSSP